MVIVVVSLAQLEYADKISVEGAVQPSALPAVVLSTTTGTVKMVQVVERQEVAAGNVMLMIDKRSHGPGGLPHVQLQIDQLLAQQTHLTDERERYRSLREQQQLVLEQRLRGLLAQRQTAKEHLDVLEQRVALDVANRHKIGRLAVKDWVSDIDVNRSQAALLLAREARLEQRGRLQALQLESEQLRATKSLRTTETAQRLAEFATELAQFDHEITKIAASGEELILAPIAGRIVDLEVHSGKQVVPGMPLLTISPKTTTLHHVIVHLPSAAAGRVRAGMSARLRYSGYPFQKYGAGLGKVASVSEVNSKTGGQRVFRAEVTVVELPAGIDHTPTGMSVSADILLATQPLWAWFAQPLRAAFGRL